MSIWVSLINDIFVSIFGIILSLSFCNALQPVKKHRIFWLAMIMFPLLQGIIYYFGDAQFLRKIYPLIIHVPLIVILYFLTRKPIWSVVSVLTAYLCCQLRHWTGLMAASLLSGGSIMENLIELVVTVPLLVLLLHFISPSVQELSDYPLKEQLHFCVIPAAYYIFDYMTQVYTDLLTSGSQVVVEFMPFVCCTAYLIFLLNHSAQERTQIRLQQIQNNLNLQLTQAVREINSLRKSQELASQYRHDLRHHLQYLSSCIASNQTEQAQSYISSICKEVEAQKVQFYCENEAANLILSAFAGRAAQAGIAINIHTSLSSHIHIPDNDLCVILSNALENALHACQSVTDRETSCSIDVQFYEKSGKLFLQVINPYKDDILFKNGIPVSKHPGHGIGVQSICAIVERYGGMYSFLTQNYKFILRLSL